jgi:2-polyprenyl-3-methyl-5-hydroxy-6-metoxy-1,4-benzoquinol methylase
MPTDLDTIAAGYDSAADFDVHCLRYGARRIIARSRGGTLLEASCASGVMSRLFAPAFRRLVIVEAAQRYADQVRALLADQPHVAVYHARLEEFEAGERFDEVVAASILEHLDDPIAFLRRAAESWLKPGGQLHIIVPNAGSLNRRIGLAMGLLPDLHHLHERDHQLGHRRVYDVELLQAHIEAAGLSASAPEGILLKPLSNGQMESWDPKIIAALFAVGKEYPLLCNQLYVTARIR